MATKKKVTKQRKRPEKTEASNGAVYDSTIKMEVKGGPHDGKTIEMDPMLVKLSADALERKHGLESVEGRIQATAGFAADLSKELVTLGYDSTPSIAIGAWVKASEYFAEMQKKTS